MDDLGLIKTIAAVLGPLIAVVSIGLNVYLFKISRRERSHVARRDEIRDALHDLLSKVDSTMLLTVHPHSEYWPRGFESLKDLRTLCARANIRVENSSLVPYDVKVIVGGLLTRVNALYYYRDDFTRFMRGRSWVDTHQYGKWKSKEHAENALHDLQGNFKSREQRLREYVRSLDD